MRRCSVFPVFAVMLPLFCAAMDPAELPEILAVVNGKPIRRDELTARLAPELAHLELERDRDQVRSVVRRCVDDAICSFLLDAELKKYAIVPSRAAAETYLSGLLRLMPTASGGKFEREIAPRLDTPEFQLKAAVHLYLERCFPPEMLTVSRTEIERYYELNRLRYRLPERWDIGVIRIDRKRADAAEVAASARARLLQGENFERVAQEVDPEGAGGKLPTGEVRELFAKELAAMAPGDVSGVVAAPDAFCVMLLRGRSSGGMMPLDEVAPFIIMEISSAKDSLALNRMLTKALKAAHVAYSQFLVPASAAKMEGAPHSGGK